MEEPEEIKAKAKTKKGKKEEGHGFEIWNELEIQRNKFMVNKFYTVVDLLKYNSHVEMKGLTKSDFK